MSVVTCAPLLTLLILAASLIPGTAGAQSPRDSAQVLRSARQEQSRFEILRRRSLPIVAWGSSNPCDERIGRFCLSYDDDDDDYEMPPEPRAILEGRHRLLEHLDEAVARLPGDRWITGHRVRYLIEAKRYPEARAAARDCRAERWWCAALAGLTAHVSGDAPAADSAFSAMIPAMPAEIRERWTDLEFVLDSDLARFYRRLPRSEVQSFTATFWDLADPFYGRPGNEVRSEHFARQVMDDLQDRAETADNLSWGSDLREILVRYGWPLGWSRTRGSGWYSMETSFIAHYADSDEELLPPAEIFLDEEGISAGEWDLENERARTGYALPMADSLMVWWRPLDHQLAVFRRADTAIVVASYLLPVDSVPTGAAVEASLSSVGAPGAIPRVTRNPGAGFGVVLSQRLPATPHLLSLEVVLEQARRGARVRRGVDISPVVPGTLDVSDLLVLHDTPELPDSLPAAMEHARGSTRVRPGETVGVFWEVYGLEGRPSGDLTMSLRVVSGRTGWLRRLAARAGVVRAAPPIQLRWQEPWPPGSVLGRAISLQIPPVPAGDYTIELSVGHQGQEPITASQDIQVLE